MTRAADRRALSRTRQLVGCAALLTAALARPAVAGGSLTVDVTHRDGQPVVHAVLALYRADPAPDGAESPAAQLGADARRTQDAVAPRAAPGQPGDADAARRAVMDQRRRRFVPYVLAVERGTEVLFPNSDNVRHHVYSFSAPKRFELKLYSGLPPRPIVFDAPGTVVLGCNIHDSMIGYIYVVDTKLFAVTDDSGRARIEGIDPGRYRPELWHPQAAGTVELATVSVGDTETHAVKAVLDLLASDDPPAAADPGHP